jgi:iron complex transport system ATP-binding protein
VSETLAVEGVAVRLGVRQVLRDVDLVVGAGEVVALAGRNGAGKTTLLRVATRVLEPERGCVRVAGRPLPSYSRRRLARGVAVVPQETRFPFPFRVAEVVLMGRAPHLGWLGFEGPRDLELARAAMARVGIEALAGRSILELSGGERQLAVVARALAQDPDLLLLDEPTAFLDLRHRIEVLQVVRELADAGKAVLVVSHDLVLAARFCDRMALLAEGAVLAVGPPAEVLTPAHLWAAFGVEADVVKGPDGIPVVLPRQLAGPPGSRLAPGPPPRAC